MKKKHNGGFSMIELVIVVAIMAALVALLAPQYIKYVEKARTVACQNNIEDLKRYYTTETIFETASHDATLRRVFQESDMTLSTPTAGSNGETVYTCTDGCKFGGTYTVRLAADGRITSFRCSKHGGAIQLTAAEGTQKLVEAISLNLSALGNFGEKTGNTIDSGSVERTGVAGWTQTVDKWLASNGYTTADTTLWRAYSTGNGTFRLFMVDLTDAQKAEVDSGTKLTSLQGTMLEVGSDGTITKTESGYIAVEKTSSHPYAHINNTTKLWSS